MKRKMLISIALIVIMLLNCMMPLFVVTAAEGEGIQLNSKLYNAVKASLAEQKIPFTCDDITHTLTLSEENKSKVTKMCLNENAISDLTGLDYFSSLVTLELSGNNLTKDSNLEVLNSLSSLTYLDLSTNQLEDVSSINSLIDSIESKEDGTVLLSGQTVTIVYESIIDESEDSNQESIGTYELPLILEKAGFVKSVWMTESGVPENVLVNSTSPSLYSIQNPVMKDHNKIQVRIADDNGNPYKGLYKLEIYIYDDPTEAASAANLNPAATNQLNGSRFYIYVVVHGSDDTAVFTPDSNLYKAVKSQLTAGQTENSDIDSYPYQVDADNNVVIEQYIYEQYSGNLPGEDWVVLKRYSDRESEYVYNQRTGELRTFEDEEVVKLPVEEITITEYDDNGKVTEERIGYNIPRVNKGFNQYVNGQIVSGETLYIQAYDEAKVFIISNTNIINKITSLILNNKEIRDLSGLEKFVGLDSYLNVSHNYLTDIDPIYELQSEKDVVEKQLQETFNYWLKTRKYGNLAKALSEVKTNMDIAEKQIDAIAKAEKQIRNLIDEASKLEEVIVKEESVQGAKQEETIKVTIIKDDEVAADKVEILPGKTLGLLLGQSQQFTAKAYGPNSEGATITWTLENVGDAANPASTIDATGKLVVGATETSKTLRVVAKISDTVLDTVTVNIVTEVTNESVLEVTPTDYQMKKGETVTFTTAVNGMTGTISGLSWSVVGNTSSQTAVVDGVLTIGADEESKEIFVTAKYDAGTENKYTTEVNENYQKDLDAKVEAIEKELDKIYGTDESDGYIKTFRDAIQEVNDNILGSTDNPYSGLYYYLSKLYEVYNKDYKLTTALTPEVNYQTIDEYVAYQNSLKSTTEKVKGMYQALINRLASMYDNDALSKFDKVLLTETLGINFNVKENQNPITEHFKDFFKDTAQPRSYWVELVEEYRYIALLMEMYNYCLINRMENYDTATTYCYAKDYLKERINDYEIEGIDASFERLMLDAFEELETSPSETIEPSEVITEEMLAKGAVMLFRYITDRIAPTYTNGEDTETLETCVGPYTRLKRIVTNITSSSNDELGFDMNDKEIAYIFSQVTRNLDNDATIKEAIDYALQYTSSELYLYQEVVALSSKLVGNASEVTRYVVLPDLKKLDVSYNALLSGFERMPELEGLKALYANSNYITDLSEVKWDDMKYLRELGLSYNYITDIQPLENLSYLQYLDVSHNLISGELKFNLTKLQGTLKELDLSYNQIEDITCIMQFLDIWSDGNDANWLAREDTLNLNLNNQNIIIDVEEPVYLDLNPQTVDIKLPKIFTQLAAIDVNRTAFGETSQNGRIESEGTYVTLNTRTAGEKQGVVKVMPMSGNGTPVETCVGEGTTATINYRVVERTVSEVKITEKVDVMKLGESAMFKAEVVGENLDNTNVVWSVEGTSNENTIIDETGKLTIAQDETAEEVVVVAESEFDPSMKAFAKVTIYENKPILVEVELTPVEAVVKTGETKEFKANVVAPDGVDTGVVWSVEGNTSANTTVSENGVLKVAADETAESLTVKAVSKADERVFKTAIVTVEKVVTKIVKVTVTPSTNVTVKAGETQKFEATVEGENVTDASVVWSIKGNESANTKISEDGILTVAADETANNITVTARAEADETVSMDVVVKIAKTVSVDGVELGYEVKDDYITTIDPKTPVSAFKSELLDNEDYKVVLMKDGEEITSGHVATGMFVQIQDKDGNVVGNGNDLLVFEIVVTGDVNGDGVANSLDSIGIKAHRNEVKGQELAGVGLEAADINNDGKVNVTDSKLLLYHRAEVKGYNLNYAK